MLDARTLSRRSFMRRMVGTGVGILSLEFVGGSIAFLWPRAADGFGVEHKVGTLAEINANFPTWAHGEPMEFRPARAFVVNVPAAKAMALGEDVSLPDPAASDILAQRHRLRGRHIDQERASGPELDRLTMGPAGEAGVDLVERANLVLDPEALGRSRPQEGDRASDELERQDSDAGTDHAPHE